MVRVGLECLLRDRIHILRGRKVAICCNPTAILPDLRHAVDALYARDDVDLRRLFGPEHGVRGTAQDMVAAGLEVTEVMQAGGWKTPVMVARYSEHLQARRGAAAKLAEKQGRVGEKGIPSSQSNTDRPPVK